ncbi:intein N-terminal splicing region [Gemmobacter megaterium]|uniref:Intein N-terminal splicing region n=1 Tax=Gemmobacter megaterium TaxID=1086013 RepID=A0A1N7KSR0_9RHOB|nr:Hint domain-containing protein [Gemmobacter megaterium]GGE03612.1 hypothetical protein GCM10011345_06380 [Gemmobacter megaterium]SIS64587.1 intein N-terminal splicing region [Gemmobacter megaterium]
MPVFARYDFNDTDTTIRDSALGNGAQDGVYLNGATASGGIVTLDGINDIAKIFRSDDFQMDRGTLAIKFTQAEHLGTGPNTVLSRDSEGLAEGGGFRVEVMPDGSILVSHETATDTVTYTTEPGFMSPGDRIELSYSWDHGGAEPGKLVIINHSQGTWHIDDVPNTLTMDMGSQNANWIVGAGQANSADGTLAGIDQHFSGNAEYLSFSDTVDNGGGGGGGRDGIVWGTDGGDLIDINYTGDNDGDRIDTEDALLAGAAPNDDFVIAGAGSDTVFAGLGDDVVFGGTGDDLVYGGMGDDLLVGDDGDDALHGDAGNDTLLGGAGDDALYGGEGDDLLSGGAGNDTLGGGAGSNTLLGGDDRDTFVTVTPGDYIDGGEGGDDYDVLDLSGAGPLRVTYDDDNPENGTVTFLDADRNVIGTSRFVNIEHVIPCFTPGTLIATPRGEIPVEDLREGDRVITRDNGIQQIRWTGRRDMSAGDFAVAPHLRPVLIRKGSLGNGLPERDMMVSPNHRLLVANDRTALYFDEHEVLVAAKHLVGDGIKSIMSSGTSYIHFMCDRHEVVLSDGAWTETFQPGDQTLKGMGNAQRNEIFELFPELKQPEGVDAYTSARRTLKRHEAVLLAR